MFPLPRWWQGCIGALATMEILMLKHGRWFTPYAVCEWRRAYVCYRSALNMLADNAISRGLMRYHMRPKAHMLGHITYHFVPRNPRYYHCFLDEDFISRTKAVAEKCHPLYMSRLTLFRYILHVCMLYSGVAWSGI